MNALNELVNTRYDRLVLYYDNLKEEPSEFHDIRYNGIKYSIPEVAVVDKNLYRKRFNLPIKTGNTKQYVFTLYGTYYKFYKKDSVFYFISCGDGLDQYTREQAFGTTMLYPYIAMAVFELIQWLTINKKYRVNIHDTVFNPLFSYKQWTQEDADVDVYLTMFPDKKLEKTDKSIVLSIFGNK